MMPPEPLRSAMNIGGAEDTSLALPNDNRLRTGQQRVLDQVHTIKRSKSRQGKSGSLSPSPTTMVPQTFAAFNEFGTFKFAPAKTNGYVSRNTAYSKSMNTQRSRTLSSKMMGGGAGGVGGGGGGGGGGGVGQYSTWATREQQISAGKWPHPPNGLKSSRSDPALAPPFAAAPAPVMRTKGQAAQSQNVFQTRANRHSIYSVTDGNTLLSGSQTRIIRPPSSVSHNEGKMGTIKISKVVEQKSAMNTVASVPDLTLKEAVEYLSHPEENYQQCGATFIQHTTYNEELTKSEVLELGGIPSLVMLLRSSNTGVSQVAAGALRNLVFKNHANKLEVQHCGGIAKALQLLKETDSTETQKQITGLLWNLSSADELKEELIATALPALTENVVIPFGCWSESAANNHIDPQVFYCATGCLRNLSSGQQSERQAMRSCPGLIDSLMSYVQSCVAEENPDDKSVENCACILHNLTFQLEEECPQSFSDFIPLAQSAGNAKDPTVGCFSPKSGKAQKKFPYDIARGMPQISAPSGVKWLCHPKAMEAYLGLLGSSEKDATLEACCGALQNLTASKGLGSSAVSQILVQKFRAPLQMASLLKSSNPTLRKTAISLLGNTSRTNGLQKIMSKQILSELTELIGSGAGKMSDATVATACNTVRKLMLADTEVGKKVLNKDLVYKLADLSENDSLPTAKKGAATLLYSLWSDKNLQGVIKKLGIDKSLLVNDATTAAHQSEQVIE